MLVALTIVWAVWAGWSLLGRATPYELRVLDDLGAPVAAANVDIDGNQVGTSASPIDPLLSDWTQLDNGPWGYLLLPGSPAIDAGSNALALDPTRLLFGLPQSLATHLTPSAPSLTAGSASTVPPQSAHREP